MGNRSKYSFLYIIFFICYCSTAVSQNYHAIQGSPYAGSLSLGNNPASILTAPYAWDVNLFSTQLKYATNAVTVYNYSLLTSPALSEYQFDRGHYRRFVDFNFNTNILNARIALDRKQSIGFGMNVRGYGTAQTSDYNYIDTIKKVRDLFKLNNNNTVYELDMLSSSWIEIFCTYSRTLWDHETARLNAGITLKAMRGVSGIYGNLKDLNAQVNPVSNPPAYTVSSPVSLAYGYSSNYDLLSANEKANEKFMKFLTHSEGGLSLDLGVEYLIKTQEISSFNDEENFIDYEWKFALSLLDLGQNNYKHGIYSRSFNTLVQGITDATLQQKFDSIRSVRSLNDSLSSIIANTSTPGRIFTVINPARTVLNVDRWLSGNFYLNAELSLNLSPLAGKKQVYVKEMNMVTITPRWETRRFGGYLPISYNNRGRMWIGGAFKAGPLLFGIHNWGNVFSSRKMANGGGYLALIIRPSELMKNDKSKMIDCPPVN